jgi:GT2 family glycosyltransferase
MTSEPHVVVVILNWNGKQDTLECLESVRKIDYPDFEIVVIDNGSADDSVPAIKARFPGISVIETGENLGYAGGNNVGMRYAIQQGADYVLLLNNDTVVDRSLLVALTRAAKSTGGDAILAAQIYFHAEPERIWYAGARVVPETATTYHEGYRSLASSASCPELVETGYASGCAFFIGTPLLSRVGLFDERFFLLYEETDLCSRARDLGVKSYVVPAAKVWHKVSASFGGMESPTYMYFHFRNRLLWAEKHLGLGPRIMVYGRVLRELLSALRPPPLYATAAATSTRTRIRLSSGEYAAVLATRYRSPLLRARLRGARDYVLRRFGPPRAGAVSPVETRRS